MKKTLSKLLIDRGMTVTELAEKTGISYNTLMNIGKRDLSFSRMVKIADVLEVSLDEFRKDIMNEILERIAKSLESIKF